MADPIPLRARHARLLLVLLTRPEESGPWSPVEWELAVRAARISKLLGTIHVRLTDAGLANTIPQRAAGLLEADLRVAQHRAAMARIELRGVDVALRDYDGPLLLLKGAAYSLLGLQASRGRIFEDVDLMVPKARLQEVEDLLTMAGWESETPDAYDQRYYREWSHELPPMRFPGRPMQLDVHHTIVPVTARFHLDAARLVAMAAPIVGSRFSALHPAHQLIHAAAHVFADSDCVSRLRDLVDIDALAREHGTAPDFWAVAFAEAARAGLERPLWYALDTCTRWLATPIPSALEGARSSQRPVAPVRVLMRTMLTHTLPPHSPERPGNIARGIAGRVLYLRYLWLRMPMRLLAYHAMRKTLRTVREKLKAPRVQADAD